MGQILVSISQFVQSLVIVSSSILVKEIKIFKRLQIIFKNVLIWSTNDLHFSKIFLVAFQILISIEKSLVSL